MNNNGAFVGGFKQASQRKKSQTVLTEDGRRFGVVAGDEEADGGGESYYAPLEEKRERKAFEAWKTGVASPVERVPTSPDDVKGVVEIGNEKPKDIAAWPLPEQTKPGAAVGKGEAKIVTPVAELAGSEDSITMGVEHDKDAGKPNYILDDADLQRRLAELDSPVSGISSMSRHPTPNGETKQQGVT